MATTLIRDALVLTGDIAGTALAAGDILIQDDRIVGLEPTGAPPVVAPDHVIDAAGRVAIPGFINCHTHSTLYANRADCDDLELFRWLARPRGSGTPPSERASTLASLLACFEMVRSGTTMACDCGRYLPGVFSTAATRVGMRSHSGALASSPELRPGKPNWPDILTQTAEAIDRHRGDRLATFFIGSHAPYSCTPDMLVATRRGAADLGIDWNIHLAESRDEVRAIAERHGTTPTRHLHDLGVLDERAILDHCVWVDQADRELIAASGARVAHCPISNAKLASGIAPTIEMRAAGIPVGLATDSVVSNNNLSMFQEMKSAILFQRATRLDAEAIVAADAFAMATRDAARVMGRGDDLGVLAIGRQADIVLLELAHPCGPTAVRALSDLVYAAGPPNVSLVMVAGTIIFANGRFTLIDEAETIAEANVYFRAT